MSSELLVLSVLPLPLVVPSVVMDDVVSIIVPEPSVLVTDDVGVWDVGEVVDEVVDAVVDEVVDAVVDEVVDAVVEEYVRGGI